MPQILLDHGAVSHQVLAEAAAAQTGSNLPIEHILLLRGAISEADLLTAQAEFHRIGIADMTGTPPDSELVDLLPAARAIALGAVPWRRAGSALVIATMRPDLAGQLQETLPEGTRIVLTLAPRGQVLAAQNALYGTALARCAEGSAPALDSCRSWCPATAARIAALAAAAGMALLLLVPQALLVGVFAVTFFVFFGNMALKILAMAATLRAEIRAEAPPGTRPTLLHRPTVSVLVPLFREPDVVARLIANLTKLDYPPERLDVILIVEADDADTQASLGRCNLPPWMRKVTVPPGHPRTKPRALNYALNFARGSLIGIYDAEDHPEPDQISKVVERFGEVTPDVGCLQGRLDYYNSHHNTLARCFTIEYASWFRMLLPGVQRLGLFVPLGGTTVFLRRTVLEEIGGWDAHNVTEDAELGLRLTRRGYRTEMVDSTTFEEANAAALPWIRQRSRWLKGYLMTWSTAMRRPLSLWRDLGTYRFLAFQVQVLFAALGFLLAPVLWSLLVKTVGMGHPLDAVLAPWHYGVLIVVMLAGLLLSLCLSVLATRRRHLRCLRAWVPVTEVYYMLGTVAAWRALAEMLIVPFFWAKTDHGKFGSPSVRVTADRSAAPAGRRAS